MAETPLIYKAISEAMKACDAVGKDSKNPQQGYKYRGIDAVMNAINPALTKAQIFAAPEVLEVTREDRKTTKGNDIIYSVAKVKYTFYAPDGSNVSATVIGEGMDSGDKSMNKAMSAAFKYALFQVFCIPTEEMIDSETDSPEVVAKKPEPKKQTPPPHTTIIDNPTADDISKIAPAFDDTYKAKLYGLFNSCNDDFKAKSCKYYKIERIEDANNAVLAEWDKYCKTHGLLK